MPKIDDLRKQYTSLQSLSDYEIVDQYAQQNGVSFETVAMDLGIQMPNKPGFGTSVKNSMYGLAQGLGQIGADFVPGVKSNNALESYGRAGTQRNPLDIMDGEGGAFENLAGNLVSRPLNTVGQIAGQAIGLMTPAAGLKLGTAAYRGYKGLDALGKVGRGIQAGAETGIYGTTSYGSMRDQQEAQGDNSTEDKLKALISAGAIGGVERFAGIEGLLAGRTGAAQTLGKTILRQGAGEAGEEIVQTPIEKFGANQEVFNMDTLDEAAAGGLAGFVGGGLAGPLAYQFGKKKELLGNANTQQEDSADQRTEQPVLGLPNRPNDTMVSFPDGSTGTQAQIDEYLNSLPEEQRVTARAQLSGYDVPNEQQITARAQPTEAEPTPAAWSFTDPDTQTLLPEPKDVVGKGAKKVQAYSLVAQARNDGLINQDEFTNFAAEITQTQKIGKVLPKIQASLAALNTGDSNGNVQMRQDEVQLQGQTEGPTGQVTDGPTQVQSTGQSQEVVNIDLAAIANKLAPQQRKIFGTLVAAARNNEIDQIISGDGKLQYTAIAERVGLKKGAAQTAINQTVAKISKLAGIDVKQYLAERTSQVRQTEPATETQLGLSPKMQDSLVDQDDIFGTEDSGASMGMAKSAGATDTDQGSVMTNNTRAQDAVMKRGTFELKKAGALDARGNVITPEGNATPSDNALKAAAETRQAHLQFLLDSPDSRNAMNDWDNETIKLSDFSETDMINYLSDYTETVNTEAFAELTGQQQTRVIEDLQIGVANAIKERLFNENTKGAVGSNTSQRASDVDAGANRLIEQSSSIEGSDTENSGDTQQRGTGAQGTNTPTVTVRKSRKLSAESALENGNIAAAEVLDKGLASKGKPLSYNEMREGAIGEGFDDFYAQGLGPVLLDMAEITVGPLGSDGLFVPRKDKSFTIQLRDSLISKNNKAHIAHVIRHELSHALDHKFNWAFSDHQKMQVVFDGAKITYVGSIAKEIDSIRQLNKDGKMSNLGAYFRYPLELADYTETDLENLDEFTLQAEMFAQLQAAWMSKDGQQAIRVFLPKAAQYLTEVNQYATRNLQANVGRESSTASKTTGGQPGNGTVGSEKTTRETATEKGLAYRDEVGNDFVLKGLYDLAQDTYDETYTPKDAYDELYAAASNKQKVILRGLKKDAFLGYEYPHQAIESILKEEGNQTSPSTLGGISKAGNQAFASRGFAFDANGNDFIERAQSTGTDAWKSLGYAMKNLTPKLLTGNHLVEWYGDKITTLKAYNKTQSEMGAMASQLRESYSKLLEKWGTYAFKNKAQNGFMMSVMQDATLAGIHPDVAFDHESNKHLTADKRAQYDQLAARYKALPDEAQAIYQEAKVILASNWEKRKGIYAKVVSSAYDPRIAEAIKNGDTKTANQLTKRRDSDIADHAKQIKELKGPYFPLLRFGDYIVIGESSKVVAIRKEMETAELDRYKELEKQLAGLENNPAEYYVEAFESRLDMEKKKEYLKNKGYSVYERKAEEYTQEARPVTAAALENLKGAISAGFDKKTGNKLIDLMTEQYIAALPEHHALQRQIKRKGVAGADANMLRSFTETIERDSFYLSRMQYAPELAKNLQAIKDQTDNRVNPDMTVDDREIYNVVVKRASADFKYEHTPIISALAQFSSIFHLGISPAYLLTNMSQPWFISVPQLAGAHGATKTFAAMRTSWVDATKIIKQGKGGTLFNLAGVDLSTIQNPEERAMLQRLKDVNKLDSTQLMDMGAMSEGMSPALMKAQKAFYWANHHIELTNRISTALATYRLERARNPNSSQEALIEKAITMVDLTQLDYSNENASYFMKPGVGLGKLNKIIYQFRKYQVGMILLLWRNGRLAMGGDKEAAKSLGYLMGTQLLFAGTTGLPITAPLLMLAYGLTGDADDEEGDLETQIRNYASDVIGPDAARVFWKGLPTALGADISSNVGMGGLFKPFPMMAARDVTAAKTGEDAIKELLFNAAGAPVSMVSKWAEGAISIGNGEIARGISQMTPRFVASVVKAKELAENGVNTRSGTQVMTADQFDGWDVALKAAGFNPVDLTEHYSAQSSKESTSRAIQDKRNLLMKKYAVAKLKGDDVADIKADIQEFNLEHPKVKLDQSALLKAIQTRKKGADEVDEAGVRFRSNEENIRGISRYAY